METRILSELGYHFFATRGTGRFMQENQIPVVILNWPLEKEEPNAITYLEEGRIDLVINIPKSSERTELTNGYLIRRKAIDHNIPLITNLQLAKRLVKALQSKTIEQLMIKRLG